MTANGWLQIALFFVVLLAVTKPLGVFMARVFSGEKTFLDPVLRPIERLLYRTTGIDEKHEMDWKEYAVSMLLFSGVSMLVLYLIERVQGLKWMPWNPQHFAGVEAASRVQHRRVVHHQHELAELRRRIHHELFHADGRPRLSQFRFRRRRYRSGHRRHSRHRAEGIQDHRQFLGGCHAGMLWVLVPACLVIALIFVSQGMIQNLRPYDTAKLVNPQTVLTTDSNGKTTTQTVTDQVIAQGPIASQEAIKIFGTNGGGFVNANSAHPFENPNPLTNFMQIVMILSLGSGLTYTLGRMTGSQRHGWAVWAAMAILCLAGVTVSVRDGSARQSVAPRH